jgi:hypothetical protein
MTDDNNLSRPSSAAGKLQRACLRLVAEHDAAGTLPTSGRFIYYELVAAGIVPKAYPGRKRTPAQDVADALYYLREAGLIPWSAIVDETRAVATWASGPTLAAALRDRLNGLRLDCWAGRPPPLVLVESRSLAGVLRPLAGTYLVPLAATNGQAGGFLHADVGPQLHDGQHVVYLGDYDHQGVQIEANTRRILAGYAKLEWERLALTAEQVAADRLPVIKKPDGRYRPTRWHDAVETEALSQAVIVRLVRERLDQLLPEPLGHVLVREHRQRMDLQVMLDEGGGGP